MHRNLLATLSAAEYPQTQTPHACADKFARRHADLATSFHSSCDGGGGDDDDAAANDRVRYGGEDNKEIRTISAAATRS